jgi:hypothetical protein
MAPELLRRLRRVKPAHVTVAVPWAQVRVCGRAVLAGFFALGTRHYVCFRQCLISTLCGRSGRPGLPRAFSGYVWMSPRATGRCCGALRPRWACASQVDRRVLVPGYCCPRSGRLHFLPPLTAEVPKVSGPARHTCCCCIPDAACCVACRSSHWVFGASAHVSWRLRAVSSVCATAYVLWPRSYSAVSAASNPRMSRSQCRGHRCVCVGAPCWLAFSHWGLDITSVSDSA